jgi:hypothetical protein
MRQPGKTNPPEVRPVRPVRTCVNATVAPDGSDEVDATHDGFVFAGPVVGDQSDVASVGFVEGGVVDDEHAAGLEEWCDFGPELGGVGFEAGEKAGFLPTSIDPNPAGP